MLVLVYWLRARTPAPAPADADFTHTDHSFDVCEAFGSQALLAFQSQHCSQDVVASVSKFGPPPSRLETSSMLYEIAHGNPDKCRRLGWQEQRFVATAEELEALVPV